MWNLISKKKGRREVARKKVVFGLGFDRGLDLHFYTSTGRRGGRSGVRVYKAGRSPDETKPDEMKRSENERTKRKE